MSADYSEGWSVRSPWDGALWGFYRTRAAAIMGFLIVVDDAAYDEAETHAKKGCVFPREYMTETARAAWPRWRRKGYMAVRVRMETCDCRVPTEPPND